MKPGHFEAKKHAYRQTQDGVVVSFVVHPHELDAGFAVAPLGTRYMVAFAQIGDDEQPVAEKKPEQKERRKFDEMPLSQQAALACQDKSFQHWLLKTGYAREGDDVAVIVRKYCGVGSRARLDESDNAAVKWRELHSRFLTETGRVTEARG